MDWNLRESGGSEIIADLELPHTGKDLGKASIEECQTEDDLDGSAGWDTSAHVKA